jgi:aspartyl-tRNA(Asn)/glutamyl-tRNA(Gln) amidotransferase subunit C
MRFQSFATNTGKAAILTFNQLFLFDSKLIMEVNDELVDKLAHLARLTFKAEEKEKMKSDLQQMITFIEKLNEVDTTGVEPLLFMTDEVNVLRDDEIKGSVSREEALKNAPLKDEQFFKVPKVIRK